MGLVPKSKNIVRKYELPSSFVLYTTYLLLFANFSCLLWAFVQPRMIILNEPSRPMRHISVSLSGHCPTWSAFLSFQRIEEFIRSSSGKILKVQRGENRCSTGTHTNTNFLFIFLDFFSFLFEAAFLSFTTASTLWCGRTAEHALAFCYLLDELAIRCGTQLEKQYRRGDKIPLVVM